MRPNRVKVVTGARLHFGPLSYRPAQGRHFGGVGLMIEAPGVELTAQPAEALSITGSTRLTEMVRQSPYFIPRPVRIEVKREIPSHHGLGSGTQLALAALTAVARLSETRPEDAAMLAERSGRARRSAIGLHGFLSGGFLIDAGHAPGETLGALACRVDFPTEWPILLVAPTRMTGMHGASEEAVFKDLSPMPEPVTGVLCRLALTEMLPAIQTRDAFRFRQALQQYGRLVGEFFAPWQGGVFSSPDMRRLITDWKDAAPAGVAQSSWGPGVAIVCESDDEAADWRRDIERRTGAAFKCVMTRALNQGAQVTLAPPKS